MDAELDRNQQGAKLQKKEKRRKKKRRGGLLAGYGRKTRTITTLLLAVTCASLAFTQLGFAGLGWNGEYQAYLIVELVPVAVAALLLGSLLGMCMGLFAGAMLLAHAIIVPLNYYELTFVTPLTSVVMLGITGLILGGLFRFALRNDPPPVKAAIYIAIVCLIVSMLYSLGFVVNTIASIFFDSLQTAMAGGSRDEVERSVTSKAIALGLRMGNVELQALIDAALMAFFCIVAVAIINKAKQAKDNMGLRAMFAVRLTIVVAATFMITSAISFEAITLNELNDATEKMNSEIDYLLGQMSNAEKRSESLANLLNRTGAQDITSDKDFFRVVELATVDSLFDGYTPDDDGTILILASADYLKERGLDIEKGYMITSSDDGRFEVGALLSDAANDEVVAAFEKSLSSGKVTRAVYDDSGGEDIDTLPEEAATVHSQIVYMLAKPSDDGRAVMMMMSARHHVFAERFGVMMWTAFSELALLAVIFFVVFLLLDRAVARRIDETNGVLARITAGDLNATVDVRTPREFASLSDGVNETVTALKGWIAEAESRIDAELSTAKAIQESALPSVFPPYPDIIKFDVYASMKAAREVGGDFYDFFLVGDDCNADEGKLGFVIADVSGKGVPAALFMMKAMTQLRDYLKVGMEIGEAVENANRQLCEGNDKGMFVTVWAGVLDYATGKVDFVNAGHNPPLLWQNHSGWRWVTEKSGLPLGLFDGLPYESFSINCGVGDQFLLYTDGVTEAMDVDGELYGESRLEALAGDNRALHPRKLVDAVRHDVAEWAKGAEQSDDITILSLEVGVPPEITATLKIPADVNNLQAVNEFIHSELDRRLCPKRVQNQLDIAVEELFVNVCHYAYPDATPDKPGFITVLRTYNADPPCITVGIMDDGIPYNPLAKPDAVTPDDIADVPIGGLGILMAKKCTDEMDYERLDESNLVTIVKRW